MIQTQSLIDSVSLHFYVLKEPHLISGEIFLSISQSHDEMVKSGWMNVDLMTLWVDLDQWLFVKVSQLSKVI